MQGRSVRDVAAAVPTSTQNTAELYTYHPVEMDWLGPDPPPLSDLISSNRYALIP